MDPNCFDSSKPPGNGICVTPDSIRYTHPITPNVSVSGTVGWAGSPLGSSPSSAGMPDPSGQYGTIGIHIRIP